MEKSTEKILEAKKNKDYKLVQQLQQELDILRKLEDKPDMEDFPKHGTKNKLVPNATNTMRHRLF